MNKSKNLVLCHHCDQLVSRSTRNRHENKRNRKDNLRNSCQKSESSDTTDSDSETRQHVDTTTCKLYMWLCLHADVSLSHCKGETFHAC